MEWKKQIREELRKGEGDKVGRKRGVEFAEI